MVAVDIDTFQISNLYRRLNMEGVCSESDPENGEEKPEGNAAC